MVDWNRRVGIVGIGRTRSAARRPDVNQLELVYEAVEAALEDARLSPADIDLNVIGDMELFQGDYQSDLWHIGGYGGYLKPGIRITTGGTTGATLCTAATNFVASGVYDIVLAVGFQKHDEGTATTGLAAIEDPLWDGWFGSGVGGGFAQHMIKKHGKGLEQTAAKLRVQVADNALRNPYAHLRQRLTVDDVMKSPYLSYPMKFLHLCPQSTAACAIIFAEEKKAKEITDKPVWVKDHVTSHLESMYPTVRYFDFGGKDSSWRNCAEKLYRRNGITEPLKQIDMAEIYDPTVWFHFELMEQIFMLPEGECFKMIERGDTARDGVFPINPSGGVIANNPIGATAMLRVAEAALQIRGDCGEYQALKEINTALASGFGGSGWTVLVLLTKDLDG